MEDKKKKLRKKILTGVLFLVVNVLVLTVLILVEDKDGNIALAGKTADLARDNIGFTLLAFSMFFVIVAGDVAVFSALLSKMGKKNNLGLSLTVSFLGRYYDRITPWSMGGEPFQMAHLATHGVGTGDGCAVTMSRHIIRFFTTAIAVILILALSGIAATPWVMIVAILSLLGGLVVPSFMLLCAFRPALGQKITDGLIRLGTKLKLIKNPEKTSEKVQGDVKNFLSGIRFLSVNKPLIALIGFCAIVEMLAYNSAPYFVIRALGITSASYWDVLVLCLYVNYSSSFAPTPGGSGIAELSFYAIFAAYIGDGYLFWAVLFWRIAVFYMPVFIGFVMQVCSTVRGIVRTKKSLG